MATTTKKATKKGKKPSVAKQVNSSLINASIAAINTSVDNAEKWQKLASKLIKKSENVRAQQINMIFDTAEAVKGQFITGTDKMKDLVGYDATVVEKAKDMAINNPVSRKVVGIVEDITEKVSENPMVKKAEKTTEDIKNKSISKFNELKGEVLEQATKIINKGEAIIEDAKTTPKAKVTKKAPVAKKTVAKKATAPKVKTTKATPKKATVAKATKVVAKAAPKKAVVKKAVTLKKTVAKAAPKAKTTVAKKATAVKAPTSKIAKKTVVKVAAVKKEVATKVVEVKTEEKK